MCLPIILLGTNAPNSWLTDDLFFVEVSSRCPQFEEDFYTCQAKSDHIHAGSCNFSLTYNC